MAEAIQGSKNTEQELKDINEFVQCPLCAELYDDGDHLAKYLLCLHTFCKSCLQIRMGNDTKSKCPKCQHEFDLEDVDNLPENFTVTSLEKELGIVLPKAEQCGLCDDEKSQLFRFCHDCESYLCHSCDDQHKKMRPLRNHKLITPVLVTDGQENKSKKSKEKEQFCKKHPNQHPTGFCKNSECQVLICETCCTDDHVDHKITDLATAFQDVKAEIEETSTDLDSKKKEFTQQRDICQTMRKMVQLKYDQQVADSKEKEQKLIKFIQYQFDLARTEFQKSYKCDIGKLPDTAEITSTISNMQTASDFANRACSSKDTMQILASSKHIKDQLRKLQNSELPGIPVGFKSDYSFTLQLANVIKNIGELAEKTFRGKSLYQYSAYYQEDRWIEREIISHKDFFAQL